VSVLKKAGHEPAPNIDTELYDLLVKSYAYIGGYPDFNKPSDIPANHTIWYAVDVDGDKAPEAVKFAKSTQYGTKWTGGATDGSSQGKQEYIDQTVNNLRTPGNYCEMSDAIMHIMITRYQIPCVNDHAFAEKVIGKKLDWIGPHPQGKYPGYNGFYTRNLFGVDHMKILLGKPHR
jgi:hypothetical protein